MPQTKASMSPPEYEAIFTNGPSSSASQLPPANSRLGAMRARSMAVPAASSIDADPDRLYGFDYLSGE